MLTINSKRAISFSPLYEKFIQASRTGKRLQPNGKKISSGTIENYGYTLRLLERFSSEKQFELRIRSSRKLSTRDLEVEKNYWKKFYKRFTDYMYGDCGYFDNYVGQNIKNIRTFFNYLNKDLALGVGDFHKLFYVRKEEVAIFPLMPEELNFLIYNQSFEASLTPRMKQVKDFFVFGCTVALRFSDLVKLKPANVKSMNGQHYLTVRSVKTSTETQVKLPPYAVDIIAKYAKQKKNLLPPFNKVNLNKFVKQLLEKAGFVQPVYLTRGKRGKIIELKRTDGSYHKTYRFCDVATTHTMRRTAITTMLSLGVPEHVVRKISGHAPGSKEFYRYVFLAQSYQDKEIDKMFAQLEQKKLIAV